MRSFRRLIFYILLFVQYVQADPAASRELIRQWVKTEHLISEEAAEWKADKKRMQDLLDIYEKELEVLNKGLISLVDLDTGGFIIIDPAPLEIESYAEAKKVMAAVVVTLKPRVVTLAKQFPKPLRDEIASDLEVLRSKQALPKQALKSMIEVLNAAGRFNRKTTLSEEVRELEGGKKMIVDVVYLGLCRGYYVTDSGNVAGVGIPTVSGWSWSSDPSMAKEVRRIIRIYNQETQPELIKLPVKILTVKAP